MQPQKEEETRFERRLRNIKNHRWLALLLLTGVFIIGLGQLTDAIDSIMKLFDKWSSQKGGQVPITLGETPIVSPPKSRSSLTPTPNPTPAQAPTMVSSPTSTPGLTPVQAPAPVTQDSRLVAPTEIPLLPETPAESIQSRATLEEIEVGRLLDEAQDLITGRAGETTLRFRVSLCARQPADNARLELARRKISEAMRRKGLPTNHRAYLLLGMIHANKDEYAKALQVVDEALTAVPEEATLISLRGELLFQLKRIDEALQAFELAVKLDPENAEYISNLGYMLHRLGKMDRAQELAEEAVRLNPFLVSGHINLGSILRDQGLTDQAVLHFSKACMLEPENADAHSHLGYLFAVKGELAAAVREYQRAIDLAPQCGQYFYNMGLIQRKIGRKETADQFIKRAEELGVKVADPPLK